MAHTNKSSNVGNNLNLDNVPPETSAEVFLSELSQFFSIMSFPRSHRLLLKGFSALGGIIDKTFGIRTVAEIPFAPLKTLPAPLRHSLQWLIVQEFIGEVHTDISSYPDEPRFAIYGTEILSHKDVWAGGTGETHREALIKTIGEAVERYAQTAYTEQKLPLARFSDLNHAVDPTSFAGPSPRQRSRWERWGITKDSQFRWTKGKSLLSGKQVWVPAQVVYVPYHYKREEPIITLPITTGAAAGLSLEETMVRGISESIEREAFMVTYLNRLSPPLIDLANSGQKLKNLAEYFKRYRLGLKVYTLPTDAPISVMLAIIIDDTDIGPAISVGMSAHPSAGEATRKAILEAQYVRVNTRRQMDQGASLPRNAREVRTPHDHALFWSSQSCIRKLDFLLTSKKTFVVKKEEENSPISAFLQNLLEFFREKNMEVVWVDLTLPAFRKYNMYIGKAIIPQLHPLFLDERYPYYGGERLYNLPVELGHLKKPLTEKELNHVPHPFP